MGNSSTLAALERHVSACAWWNGTEDASADHVIGRRGSTGYALGQDANDFPFFDVTDGVTLSSSTGITDIDAGWYFLCGAFDTTADTTYLYVNGNLEATNTAGAAIGSLTTAINFAIGENSSGSNDAAGLIAYGVMLSSVTLNASQVSDIRFFPDHAMIFALEPNRSGFWPLWGDDAATELDLGGTAFTGTVTGALPSSSGPPISFGASAAL